MNHRRSYVARINRVIDHIDAHLAEPLDLETLAAVAHFSPWHFHRVFVGVAGETLAQCVRRRRLEVAARRLLASDGAPASHIALDLGFGSPEAFTRAFRAHFGATPTEWRHGAARDHAKRRQHELSKIHQAERNAYQDAMEAFRDDADLWPTGRVPASGGPAMNVQIKTLPEARVAYMRHVGPYGSAGIPRTWQRFAAWCEEQGFMQPRRTMVGVCPDDPTVTPPDKCRYDCCVEVDAGFVPKGEIGVQTIAGGRYACAQFTGTPDRIHESWSRLMSDWMPGSGYEPDDRATFELYAPDFAMDEKTGAFSCLLCMPVRAV